MVIYLNGDFTSEFYSRTWCKKEFIVHSSKVSTSTENLVSIPLSLDYDGLSLAKDDKEIPSCEDLDRLKLQVVAGKLFYKATLFV